MAQSATDPFARFGNCRVRQADDRYPTKIAAAGIGFHGDNNRVQAV
jgi:hypothetical protein